MEFFSTTSAASRRAGSCIIVGVYEKGKLGVGAADIDKSSKGFIGKQVKAGDISGKPGSCRIYADIAGVQGKRVMVIGLGKSDEFGVSEFRTAIATAATQFKDSKITDIVSYLSLENIDDRNAYYLARYTVESIGDSCYTFTEMKSKKNRGNAVALKKIGVAVARRSDRQKADLGANHGHAIVEGMTLAKDLGNLPPNVCTPSHLARAAQKIARNTAGLSTKVLNEVDIKRLGMHSFLSVTSGTVEPAKLIVMQYKGAGKAKPIVLVGKGITFDAGGISLKPGPGMDEMKFDMCGAASVIATMSVISKLKPAVNLTVIVPACENLPSGTATRPGDIIKSMSGLTIEVLNTDAEGRLILCDALTYARRLKPAVLVDVATLTGACVVALGHHRTAVMSHSDELAGELTGAGFAADDQAWRLPLAKEYEKQLRSNFADFANVGGRDGGAITAGCFLAKFTKDMHWAHLDIAGTAWKSGARKGSTGRPVPLLTEFILQRAGALP